MEAAKAVANIGAVVPEPTTGVAKVASGTTATGERTYDVTRMSGYFLSARSVTDDTDVDWSWLGEPEEGEEDDDIDLLSTAPSVIVE